MTGLDPQLDTTAAEVEQYIHQHLFDHRGLMYSGIDALTGKPFPPETFTPMTVPRRADVDPWAYWTYEDSVMCLGLYLDAQMRKHSVTRQAECLEHAAKAWLAVKDVYYASQVYGIGSFLRPYGGFERMGLFVEPLGTDQASPLFSGLYLYWKQAPPQHQWEIADILIKTLSWYAQQHFRYFYYKAFIHHWEVDWPQGWQHATSYYLPAIAFAAKVTGEPQWRRLLTEKLALLGDPRYNIFQAFNWGGDLPVLAELLGERFAETFTRDVLDAGYKAFREHLATFTEPGMTRYICTEPKREGFQPHMKPFDRRNDPGLGFAYYFCVHQGRERPWATFPAGMAALGCAGAREQALSLLRLRSRVPHDFTAFVHEDHSELPEAVYLYARSVGPTLILWLRDYWLLRGLE